MSEGKDLPDRRKHGYRELEERLEEHVEDIRATQRRFFIGGIVVLAIIGLTTALSIFGFGVILREQGDQQDQIEKQAANIQDQRAQAIGDDCKDQNQRHDQAVNKLMLGAQADIDNAESQAEKKEIARRRDVTIGLIDALSPVQDCEQLVAESVQAPPPDDDKEGP